LIFCLLIADANYSLGTVEGDKRLKIALISHLSYLIKYVLNKVFGKVATSTVKGESLALFGSLKTALVDIFKLGEGELFLLVIKMVACLTLRCRNYYRLMIPENLLV